MEKPQKAAAKLLITIAAIVAAVSAPLEYSAHLPYAVLLALALSAFIGVCPRLLASRLALTLPFFSLIVVSRIVGGQDPAETWHIVLKALFSMVVLSAYSSTTPFKDILGGLSYLGLPKVMVETLMLQHRYMAVLEEELLRMRRAMSSRTARQENAARRLLISGNLIGLSFVRSFERYERVYQAMASRGYGWDDA
jgi:cobalt/nickel transport system permease protein